LSERPNQLAIKNGISSFSEYCLFPSTEVALPEEIRFSETVVEGAKKVIVVNAYERDGKARDSCIEAWGSNCVVCDFDFEKLYGAIGKGFIHVHHLVPLATIGKEYTLDPKKDLRPVCPNCHAMLHRKKKCVDHRATAQNSYETKVAFLPTVYWGSRLRGDRNRTFRLSQNRCSRLCPKSDQRHRRALP
jgi:hypothetical protein